MKPNPVSMHSWLHEFAQPGNLAEFLVEEIPIRFAERIRWIQQVQEWQEIPELTEAHLKHMASFSYMLKADPKDPVKFQGAVQKVLKRQDNMVPLMTRAMQKLRQLRGEEDFDDFSNKFLDNFLLNRLGCNLLLSHYLAVAHPHRKMIGIIDPQCDAVETCRAAGEDIVKACRDFLGRTPQMSVEGYSQEGVPGRAPRFAYIPGILEFVVRELLKNSFRATLDLARSEAELQSRPIRVIVCADEDHVMIRISDKAQGIPIEVGTRVWSYMYTTTSGKPSPLSGYGVGLPLSRLHARYLGGTLQLISLPGYGTDAYLSLPRVDTEMVEVVPDEDGPEALPYSFTV
eukprot:CAMPEP_0181442678 /NCGR_PEP_ID=MMETSP1110-20121109/24151_1 /TAXON_ID=174948 /ORGANISM="Symbiodinium sp., Strain CCMP421" /LENGTH=343 /DNA_ID=CAMNT_0023566609 /DNA_START=131 /DNA_END=1162 /DNA_ORIENTATION=+